jgi:hypothetical protein
VPHIANQLGEHVAVSTLAPLADGIISTESAAGLL